MAQPQALRLSSILRDTVVNLVRREGPDLSARQFGVLLICYLEEGPHTVRGLAARLAIAKPAITRALDRLEELTLAERKQDPRDRRSIIVVRTPAGEAFMEQLHEMLEEAARASSSAYPAAVARPAMAQFAAR